MQSLNIIQCFSNGHAVAGHVIATHRLSNSHEKNMAHAWYGMVWYGGAMDAWMGRAKGTTSGEG